MESKKKMNETEWPEKKRETFLLCYWKCVYIIWKGTITFRHQINEQASNNENEVFNEKFKTK